MRIRSEEERDGSFIEKEGASSELEVEVSPSGGGIGPHEGVPSGRRGEEVNEAGIEWVAEPRTPHAVALQLPSQLVASAVVAQQSHLSLSQCV